MGQDAEISKLTDGGGVLGEGSRGIFLTETCPWTCHRPFFLKDRCKRLAEREGEIEIPT